MWAFIKRQLHKSFRTHHHRLLYHLGRGLFTFLPLLLEGTGKLCCWISSACSLRPGLFSSSAYLLFPGRCKAYSQTDGNEELLTPADDNPKACGGPLELVRRLPTEAQASLCTPEESRNSQRRRPVSAPAMDSVTAASSLQFLPLLAILKPE